MEIINSIIDDIIRQNIEHTERSLAEIITKYDFIVGSIECKAKLMEVLPEGANIICSRYIQSPTIIYAIKKFDSMDFLPSVNLQQPKTWKCERCGKLISYMADFCHECANELLGEPPKPFESRESENKE